MRFRVETALPLLLAMGIVVAEASAGVDPKPLNRSIYVPIEFVLCEHLENAIFYQNDVPTSRLPAKRVFQFTYYPDLERLLPEVVQVRVEGSYVGEGDPFVARLAVTSEGVHTAHRTRELDTRDRVQKQRHKIDVRLEPRTLHLSCERFCKRARTVAAAQGQP